MMGRRRALSRERVVIVGGGRAAVSAAAELRQGGFRGEVIVLSEEPDPPYHRPSCSKGLLTGNQLPSDVGLALTQCEDVRWLLARRAVALDPNAHVVDTDTGESFPYDGLVIATGSHAVMPASMRAGRPGLHVLHRLADAWALRRDLRNAESVAIVGAGLTGCEAAWAVRSLARECVLIDSNPQVMTRAVGAVAGAFITEEVRRERVRLHLGVRLQEIQRCRNGRWRLWLSDGDEVETDLVVATVGERPGTAWLKGTPGLDISDGVLCDETLRVVGAQGIVAAGTVARWPNLRDDPTPRRAGQWITALLQGRAAARALLAGDDPVPPVTPLNRAWSDQFGLRIQTAGEIGDADAEVRLTQMRSGRRDIARSGLLVSYLKHDRMVGLVAVNATQAFTAVTRSLLLAPRPLPLSRHGRPDHPVFEQRAARPNGHSRRAVAADRAGADVPAFARPPVREQRRTAPDRPEVERFEPRRDPAPQPPRRHRTEQPVHAAAADSPDVAGRESVAARATRRPEQQPAHQSPMDSPDVIWRESTMRGRARPDRARPEPQERRTADDEPDIIWRESTMRGPGRARYAERTPPGRLADDDRQHDDRHHGDRHHGDRHHDDRHHGDRPARASRPTVRDQRSEQEPESWTYS